MYVIPSCVCMKNPGSMPGFLERFIKYIGSENESFHQNAIQLIYGDRIGFVDLNTHQAFIIENKTLAAFQKTIFRALYRRLK